MQHKHDRITVEFSSENKRVLADVLDELKAKNKLNSVLEIGVFRSKAESSTKVILDNKLDTTKYFGIDLLEQNLVPIRDDSKNVFALCTNSSNLDEIMNFCKSHSVEKFDLILIDGWHSINQVVLDWRFVEHLNDGGFVVMHDTNYHPGPHCVFDAIDETKFEKARRAIAEFDWGIATARKL
jgi:hypothetical protein